MRVFLVDDSAVVRQRLVELLSSQHGVEVVGEATDAQSAIVGIEALLPDAVLLDLGIPGGGQGVLEGIKHLLPSPVVVVLTNHAQDQYRRQCFALGADYFLDKSIEFGRVPGILAAVARPETP